MVGIMLSSRTHTVEGQRANSQNVTASEDQNVTEGEKTGYMFSRSYLNYRRKPHVHHATSVQTERLIYASASSPCAVYARFRRFKIYCPSFEPVPALSSHHTFSSTAIT